MAPFEQGAVFTDPHGATHLLCTTILVWLGDHEENNELSFLYAAACRRCFKVKDDNGQWLYRDLQKGLHLVDIMQEKFRTPKCKGKAYKMAQDLQQHIGYV